MQLLASFDIEAVPVCYDAETIDFHICASDKKITISTDLGHISQTAVSYIKASNLLVLGQIAMSRCSQMVIITII